MRIPKFGVFGNQINIANSYYGGNGAVAVRLFARQPTRLFAVRENWIPVLTGG